MLRRFGSSSESLTHSYYYRAQKFLSQVGIKSKRIGNLCSYKIFPTNVYRRVIIIAKVGMKKKKKRSGNDPNAQLTFDKPNVVYLCNRTQFSHKRDEALVNATIRTTLNTLC